MAMNTYENGSSESRDDDLRRTILDFIQNYAGNDPLEPYLRCIKWLKEMNPPGSVKVVLQEVLELAANTFVPDKRYKSDLRYLKVWIQYADCCLERGGIFPFLEANGIGLEHGLFYEAYAMLLESSRDYSKADYVFQVGISRGAQPLERVLAMYNNFRSRMVARQRRKVRQEQEQKALLARLSGGAMRPLADNFGIEGLPILPSFQSNAREDPLPDMQDSVGSYAGPAPILIGSKIYESSGLKAETSFGLKPESSFEEERLNHWIQKKPPQLPGVIFNNEQAILNSNYTGANEVYSRPMDSTQYKQVGATSNGYLPTTAPPISSTSNGFIPTTAQPISSTSNGFIPTTAQPISSTSNGFIPTTAQPISSTSNGFIPTTAQPISSTSNGFLPTTAQPMSATSNGFPPTTAQPMSGRNGFENVAVTVPNVAAVDQSAAGQNELLDDVSLVTKSVTDDIMAMFGDSTLQTESRPAREHSSLPPAVYKSFRTESKPGTGRDDVTMNTKAVTDDIMAMFSAPRNPPETGNSYSNMMGADLSGSRKVMDDVTIDTKAVNDDIMAMFSGSPAPRARVQTTNNVSYIGTPSQNGSLRPPPAGNVPYMGTPSQNGSLRPPVVTPANTSTPPGNSESKTFNARADYKASTPVGQQQLAGEALKSELSGRNGTITVQKREDSKDGKEAATIGQWATKEIRSSKPEVVDLSNGTRRVSKEGSVTNVRSTPSRKRSSWTTSVKDTQCIYLSDEEEKVDIRENKKPRTSLSSNEGLGVKDSRTPVLERSLAMREKQHPSQYSPAVSLEPTTDVGSPIGSSLAPRNILEPTLSTSEHRKPGGQIYPWDQELVSTFLKHLNPPLSKYKGYVYSSKKYSGKVTLASLASTSSKASGVKNKPLELGKSKYQLKASTGHGAFAQVYLAEALSETGESRRVVLKVQKPPCPWEFYIYRQLDMRIPSEERCAYGCAQNIHIFADCSFMECDFGQYGTLQDVINTYLKKGQRMDEPLCIFYTIEMLHMLEDLHKVGLIHGDFKPDNLLIRSSSAQLGFWAPDKPGAWQQQGVSLIDWGRSIDLSLFAEGVEFVGDSKTDGFRCTEMIEKKPWVFQVDTYGLCGVVHCLLHGNYMEIDKRPTNGTSQVINRPKAPYKRYWNVNLWQNFFETLLNLNTAKSYDTLHSLRRSFEGYLRSDSGLTKKLRDLMVKQNTMLQSRK